MRVISGGGTVIMHRSASMNKYNYSHCPLKKRPIQIVKEEEIIKIEKDLSDDNSEPENLCIKPQDLSTTSSCKPSNPPYRQHHQLTGCKTFKLKRELESSEEIEDDKLSFKREPHSPNSPIGSGTAAVYFGNDDTPSVPNYYYHRGRHFLGKTSFSNGGPLEPLNLNTSSLVVRDELVPSSTWPRAVPAHYPPNYVPPSLNYFYTPTPQSHGPLDEIYQHYHRYYPAGTSTSPTPPSPSIRICQDPGSPPHAFTPFRSSHARVPVIAATTNLLSHHDEQQQSAAAPNPTRLYYPAASSGGNSSPFSSASSDGSSNYFQRSLNNGDVSPQSSVAPPISSPEDLSSSPLPTEDMSSANVSMSSSKKSTNTNHTTTASRYKCTFCSKSYSTYSGLTKHQQFHCSANEDSNAAKKTFSCKYCEKVYVSLGALKMHIRTHTLPCKCQLCGKAFSRPWLLQGHIRTHTGEKPFTCPYCDRAFADRSNLRAHLQTHSDVKKYSCSSCSKTFSRMSLLSKHNDGGCPGVSVVVTNNNNNNNNNNLNQEHLQPRY